jgi:cytochrome oxidase assembly protein ShyY1
MTVLKQILIVLAGLAAAAIMSGLGIWQLHVYNEQGRHQAENRAAATPVALTSVARPGQEVGDAYGRTVRFTGRYDSKLQVLLPVADQPGRFRVLTAFRLSSGGAVPVLRGISSRQPPAPPTGSLTQTGVLLPSEGADGQGVPSDSPTSVNLAALAQRWSPQLVNGYATLSAAEARSQSLTPAPVELPTSHGRLRNGFYALQWWVFAAFAVVMAIRMARDLGHEAEPEVADVEPDEAAAETEDVISAEPPRSPAELGDPMDRPAVGHQG